MNRLSLVILMIILQVGVLLGMIQIHHYKIAHGYPVLLAARIYDDFDGYPNQTVLRLRSYNISSIPHDILRAPIEKKDQYDPTVYVILQKDTVARTPLFTAKDIHHKLPNQSLMPFIKGTDCSYYSSSTSSIEYDIDSFYLPKPQLDSAINEIRTWGKITTHRAKDSNQEKSKKQFNLDIMDMVIETDTTRRVGIDVRLDPNGTPMIAGIIINGKRFE